MVRVYSSRVAERWSPDTFDYYCREIPAPLLSKIFSMRRWEDRQASLIGKLLLKKGLSDFQCSSGIDHVGYSVFNRPCIQGGPDFNISHSEDCVVCVVSDTCKVGIDIEFQRALDIDDFRSQWTDEEWASILTGDIYAGFYQFWARKEAVIKANGKGLGIELGSISVIDDLVSLEGQDWYLSNLDGPKGYSLCLATDAPLKAGIEFEDVPFIGIG